MKFIVVYEQSPNNWGAYVPDVPGCIATAKTREETEKLIKEAIEFHLEGILEDGDPMPQPGTWTGTVEVELPSADAVKANAASAKERPARKRASA